MPKCNACKEREAWFRIERKTGRAVCNLCDECYLEAGFTTDKGEENKQSNNE